MRFIRHLIASCLVIATICAVALVAGLGGQRGKPAIFCPNGCDPRSLGLSPTDPTIRALRGTQLAQQQLHLDWGNLFQTVVLGTAVALLVTAVDLTLRRRRRTIRLKATSPGRSPGNDRS
jgi:hypothetical protein